MSENDAVTVAVSVVVPVRNEAGNIAPLIAEITAALNGEAIEIVFVDDGSDDDTAAELRSALAQNPALRVLHHDRGCGQSAAIRTGVMHARGGTIVTMDGDGQNDPADVPELLTLYRGAGAACAMVVGHRRGRRDSAIRRFASLVGNSVRNVLLGDDTPDTGCSLKVFGRDAFLRLPYFDHMHRFLPALMRREGCAILHCDVRHRPRVRGVSKYGVFSRLWVGLVDLGGVMWLQARMSRPSLTESSERRDDSDEPV